jgi:hypothetical protein
MNREAIYSALWALVSSVDGFITKSRRIEHWANVPPAEQPAMFQMQTAETAEVTTKLPTKWTFHVDLYLYAVTNDGRAPAQVLNPLIDAVCNQLKPQFCDQTLGGLVHRCRIAGAIRTDEGALGDQGVVIIPIEILVHDD